MTARSAGRDTLAMRYWAHLADQPDAVAELADLAERCAADPSLRSAAGAPLLPRPLFLTATERDALEADLAGLQALLLSLPERLYDGDVARMCNELGFSPSQTMAVEETWRDDEVLLARADLLRAADGFRCIEYNLHSSLGGLDAGPWHAAYLEVPTLRRFLDTEGLAYLDPLDGAVAVLRQAAAHHGIPDPALALVDWPTSYPTQAPRLERLCGLLRSRGLAALHCHLGELSWHRGRLSARGQPIDLLYRVFLLEDLVGDPRLIVPVLRAHRAHQVVLAMSFLAELVGNKGTLAMLSHPHDPHAFSAAERALVERFVPPTRWAGRDPEADLAQQPELVLKPAGGYSGHGVVAGWRATVAQWRAALSAAAGKAYVVQRRVHARPEYVPSPAGAPVPVEANWGVFLCGGRFGGAMIRAVPAGSAAVVSTSTGASIGGCFVAPGRALDWPQSRTA